jgi:hypothetical protein
LRHTKIEQSIKGAIFMSKNKRKKVDDFQHGNLKDRQLNSKHSLPEASKFTEPDQNRLIKQRPQLYP